MNLLKSLSKHKTSLGAMIGAVALQLMLLCGAIFVVIMLPSKPEEPNFDSKHEVMLPHEDMQHQMEINEFEQASAPAFQPERISVESIVPDIPPLPDIPMAQSDPSEIINPLENLDGLFQQIGNLTGQHSLGGQGSSVSLLGINDNTERIVIAFDISASVITNMNAKHMPLPKMNEEVKAMIETLNANTTFTLCQFVRAYDFFSPTLLPATVANKKAACNWLDKKFSKAKGSSQTNWIKETPNGIQAVSKAIFALEPESVFIFSDGDFQRTPAGKKNGNEQVPLIEWQNELTAYQRKLSSNARIHFIGFGVKENARNPLKNIIRQNSGQYKEF